MLDKKGKSRLRQAKKKIEAQHRKFKGRGGHNFKGKPVKLGTRAEG